MSNIDVVTETNEYTVVSKYTPLPRQSEAYQSEYQLEQEFINMLSQQGYDYITIRNEKALIDNLRVQLEKLNDYTSDDLRGSVDGWDFKQYVLGIMFYRYISENITQYINENEHATGDTSFDYAKLTDDEAEEAREDLVNAKGFFILPCPTMYHPQHH